jgi:transposase
VVEPDDWCHACGCLGVPRDSVLRRLAHVPLGWRATILHVRIRRYRCSGCGQVWRQDTTAAAAPRAKLSTQAVLRALKSVVIDRMSIARIAAGLGVSWHTVNDAVRATGHQLLIADPTRFDGVQVLGVDEHAWRHTRRGDKFVTVIIDLTPVRDGAGPSRLLDMAEGRSKQVFKTWLEAQTPAFRDGIEIVAMDGFTGVPAGLPELSRLGRTLKQRAADVLAYFDRPGTSNGPTEAINGRLEHLRGTALGFRNLTNYITRSLLDAGGFRPRLHPLLR